MKISIERLKQLIKEEFENILKEAPYGSFGPPGPDNPNYEFEDDEDTDPYNTEKYDDPVYQLNDELVTAAKNALLEVVEAKMAPNFSPEEVAAAVDNFELDLEEPLMDFLLPYAERILQDHRAETRRRRG